MGYIILMVFMSLISFILFAIDKKKAIKGKERIKEKTLLLSTIINGAMGSFLARIICRHKTDKIYFTITIYLSLLFQLFTLLVLMYFAYLSIN
jgi:uncharacterized membrane protein YsdA (DUF1294 family)